MNGRVNKDRKRSVNIKAVLVYDPNKSLGRGVTGEWDQGETGDMGRAVRLSGRCRARATGNVS